MDLYSSNQTYKLFHGNMLDLGEVVDACSIDSVITDPPYELNFMGKGWDNSGIAFQPDTWRRCLEALKPGGYLLAFGGSRTYHRIACAIEDAGFEIRDCIMWLYGSGFPKSLNIGLAIDKKNGVQGQRGVGGFNVGGKGEQDNRKAKLHIGSTTDGSKQPGYSDYKSDLAKQRAGWGTALKPSYEPIIVARKPLEGSCTDNVIKYGVGGINIDECRVAYINQKDYEGTKVGFKEGSIDTDYTNVGRGFRASPLTTNNGFSVTGADGRFPANTILTYDESDFEEVCSGFPNTKSTIRKDTPNIKAEDIFNHHGAGGGFNDEGSAARYFYCAKASKRDRDEGLGTETTIDIILSDKNGKIWKGENIIRDEKSVNADIEAYLKSDTEEYGILNKGDLDLNIMLYMKNILEKYQNECKSTTKMGINSTTIYQILNWLTHLNTKENTLDVKKYDELYTSLVESAENGNLLTLTIKEKTESVHDVENAVLKMQLRIREKEKHSTHPTVKPTDLMQYLVRLVTPNGGTVLDPFNGSGSTGKAVMYENKDRNKNYKYIGIELTEEYLPIAKARIEYVINKGVPLEQEQPIEQPTEQRKESALF